MAKIHVKGGSPLRLEFENDEGFTLKVHLEAEGKGRVLGDQRSYE